MIDIGLTAAQELDARGHGNCPMLVEIRLPDQTLRRTTWNKPVAYGGETFLPNVAVSTAPSCPPRTSVPTVGVLNANRDTNVVSADSIEALVRKGQFGQAYDLERKRIMHASTGKLPAGRLRVSFDPGRSLWPGHYTGLAARLEGRDPGPFWSTHMKHEAVYERIIPQDGAVAP